jgi:hypothetical protein
MTGRQRPHPSSQLRRHTRPDRRTHLDATPNLLDDDQHGFEETTHRLRARQASLQPLTSTAMAGTQADEQSARMGDRCEPSDPDHRIGDHGCRPDLLLALNKSVNKQPPVQRFSYRRTSGA